MFSSEEIKSFNQLEYQLYNYVITNAEKVIYMRIRDLAQETHVSTSTILRFCRKINCDGFSEFKVKLKIFIDETKQSKQPNLKNMHHLLSEFMERTLKGNLDVHIGEAIKVIEDAESVLFVGFGGSGIMAQYGARCFSSFGKFSISINDPFFPINAQYLKNNVAIALSVSGETQPTINQVSKLKEQGNTIVSITNSKESTLAQISDVTIPYYVTEEYSTQSNITINTTTQFPVMYIIEDLAREIYNSNANGKDA
jgi:DNA-binding MurR/RpiR family transcriptional regulator